MAHRISIAALFAAGIAKTPHDGWKIALDHALGRLPEPEFTHRFF